MPLTQSRTKFGRWVMLALKGLVLALLSFAFWISFSLPAQAAESRVMSIQLGDFIVHQTKQQREGCLDTQLDECWETISQEIEGGRFTPPDIPPKPLKPGINLLVDMVNKTLMYYHLDEYGNISPIEGWVVVTAPPEDLGADEVEGFVRLVDREPTWGPTPSALALYPELRGQLKEIGQLYFPFGHPSNAMGVAKILIDWRVPESQRENWLTKHLHGSRGYGTNLFADSTLGCVRLLDDELLRLLSLAGPNIKGARVLLYR